MEFCCSLFESKWKERSRRGASIYVCPPKRAGGGPEFVLLSRGIDRGAGDVLAEIPTGTKLSINLAARIRIHFCPWCGRKLSEFYGTSYPALIDPEILKEMKEEGEPAS